VICPNKTIHWDVNWPPTLTGFNTYFSQCGTTDVDFNPSTAKFTTIYPNPASGQTTIDFYVDLLSEMAVEIYSISGKKVYSASVAGMHPGFHYVSVPLDDFSGGIYIVRLIQDSETTDIRKLSVIK
jgi:hypothetical protein